MNEELIPIAAQVGDRSYRIKVEPKNKELVLRTLEQINQKLLEFKTTFSGKDMQDYLSMTLLWYATQPQAPVDTPAAPAAADAAQNDALIQELALLEQLLDAEINKR